MIDTPLLRKKIKDSGFKAKFIADKLGLSEYGFMRKVDGKNEFKVSEIKGLVSILDLSAYEKDQIFFADVCSKYGTHKCENVYLETENKELFYTANKDI